MKFSNFSFVVYLLFIIIDTISATSNVPPKKISIGVKVKPKDCPMKSKKGDLLHVHYRGLLEDGTEFDSSYPRNNPLTFGIGNGQVIKGWDHGLLNMCEGEHRKLVIPPDLAYGDRGAPPKIPGGATLTFHVELVKIERHPAISEFEADYISDSKDKKRQDL